MCNRPSTRRSARTCEGRSSPPDDVDGDDDGDGVDDDVRAAHLVLVEHPGGHAGDDEEEKWKELQSSRKEDSALGVRDVLACQSPLDDHLDRRYEVFDHNFILIIKIRRPGQHTSTRETQ